MLIALNVLSLTTDMWVTVDATTRNKLELDWVYRQGNFSSINMINLVILSGVTLVNIHPYNSSIMIPIICTVASCKDKELKTRN